MPCRQPRPGILLGSTNPIILSAARHYPHILRIGPASPFDGPVQGVFGSLAKSTAGQSFKEAQTSPHGLFSERKRHIKKDTAVLKAVEERMRAGDCELGHLASEADLILDFLCRSWSRRSAAAVYEHTHRTLLGPIESLLCDTAPC